MVWLSRHNGTRLLQKIQTVDAVPIHHSPPNWPYLFSPVRPNAKIL
jgi:hypothetical protein